MINFRSFEGKIAYFNGMYRLPIAAFPSFAAEQSWQNNLRALSGAASQESALTEEQAVLARLVQFKKIMQDEVKEVQDIIDGISTGVRHKDGVPEEEAYNFIDALTDLADWLGDITVYCASEAQRYGIPMKDVLTIIMDSNFSKLGEDGQPIIKDGKVQKGPHYWKPEPLIKELFYRLRAEQQA